MQSTTSPHTRETPPTCPQCGAAMVQRTQRASGKAFYGCRRYPKCKGTVAISASQEELDWLQRENRRLKSLLEQDPDKQLAVWVAERKLAASEQQVRHLQTLLEQARRDLHTRAHDPAVVQRLDTALKQLIARCHPDKWQDAPVAVELVKHLNDMRHRLREGQL